MATYTPLSSHHLCGKSQQKEQRHCESSHRFAKGKFATTLQDSYKTAGRLTSQLIPTSTFFHRQLEQEAFLPRRYVPKDRSGRFSSRAAWYPPSRTCGWHMSLIIHEFRTDGCFDDEINCADFFVCHKIPIMFQKLSDMIENMRGIG